MRVKEQGGYVPLSSAWANALQSTAVQPHVSYQEYPIQWMTDVLGIPEHTLRWSMNPGYENHEWDGTHDPMAATLEGLVAWKNVGVESATTTGKTFLGAAIVLWFLACFKNALVVTVAPKEDQLKLHIWKEIAKLWPNFQKHFPTAKRDELRIRMLGDNDVWAAHGFVAGVRAEEVEGSATKAQGFHAEHMLIVFEETPGISKSILTAFKNTCRAPHNMRLAFGNPDNELDALHEFCNGARTEAIRISAYDHPNVVSDNPSLIPGAVSRQGIDDAVEEATNDGGTENRMFKSRVRGISPSQASDALIHLSWLGRAGERYTQLARAGKLEGIRAKGVDVANSENGDKAAIADFIGAALENVRAIPCPDSNALGRTVASEMTLQGVLPEHVGVDPVGVGAGTVNELASLRKNVRRLHGSAKPVNHAEKAPDGTSLEWVPDSNLFLNLRSQMWWQLREDLRKDQLAINPEVVKRLRAQLIQPTYDKRNGKTVVESKDEIKKRMGGRSPDEADAIVYGNWVRPRAAVVKPGVSQIEGLAPSWDYEQGKLVRPVDAFAGDSGEPGRRLTRHFQAPRYRRSR